MPLKQEPTQTSETSYPKLSPEELEAAIREYKKTRHHLQPQSSLPQPAEPPDRQPQPGAEAPVPQGRLM